MYDSRLEREEGCIQDILITYKNVLFGSPTFFTVSLLSLRQLYHIIFFVENTPNKDEGKFWTYCIHNQGTASGLLGHGFPCLEAKRMGME